jgi:hypothetical protein
MSAESTIRKSVLPNGLRVLTEFVPYVDSVSIGIWVAAGARDESRHQHGGLYPSHLLQQIPLRPEGAVIAALAAVVLASLGAPVAQIHEAAFVAAKKQTLALIEIIEEKGNRDHEHENHLPQRCRPGSYSARPALHPGLGDRDKLKQLAPAATDGFVCVTGFNPSTNPGRVVFRKMHQVRLSTQQFFPLNEVNLDRFPYLYVRGYLVCICRQR